MNATVHDAGTSSSSHTAWRRVVMDFRASGRRMRVSHTCKGTPERPDDVFRREEAARLIDQICGRRMDRSGVLGVKRCW